MISEVQHTAVADRPGGDIEGSVVMPCLNEARTVSVCVAKAAEALHSLRVRREMVVADNGRIDGSQAIAAAAGARVVVGTGPPSGAIAAARGTYIIMGDADDATTSAESRGSSSGCRPGTSWSRGTGSAAASARGACRGTTGTSATRF